MWWKQWLQQQHDILIVLLGVMLLTLWPLVSPPVCPLEDILNCASRFLISCWNSSRSCSRSTACSYKDVKGLVIHKLALCTLQKPAFLKINQWEDSSSSGTSMTGLCIISRMWFKEWQILEHHFKQFLGSLGRWRMYKQKFKFIRAVMNVMFALFFFFF